MLKKQILSRITSKKYHTNLETITFYSLTKEWLCNIKFKVKESTFAQYKTITDAHLIPYFGNYMLSDITDETIKNYIEKLESDKRANKSINDILILLKRILKFGSYEKLNCSCKLSNVFVKNHKNIVKILSERDQRRLSGYLIENLNYRNFGIYLSLYTGIRIGELCALKWSDIDMIEKTISINKTILRIKNVTANSDDKKTKVIISLPKTPNSLRKIPLSDLMPDLIDKLNPEKNAYVLTNDIEKYMEPRCLQYYFKKALQNCNIDDINFHALRHTFATRCIENGVDVKTLSEILGHSNVNITLDKYVHSSLKQKRKCINTINLLYSHSACNQ